MTWDDRVQWKEIGNGYLVELNEILYVPTFKDVIAEVNAYLRSIAESQEKF